MPKSPMRVPPMRLIWRGHIPRVVAVVIGVIVATSLACYLTDGSAHAIRGFLVLQPGEALRGQVWRVVTFSLVAEEMLSLVLGGLMLYWLGRDLATQWGARRFVLALAGSVAFAGVMTTLAGLFIPTVRAFPYFGLWPLTEALMLGWAAEFRDREVRLFMMLPARGRQLIVFTVALLVLWGFMMGPVAILPHAFAQLFMAGYTGLLLPPSLRMKIKRLLRRNRRPDWIRAVDDDRPPRPRHWN